MTDRARRAIIIGLPALVAMALQLVAIGRFGAGLSPDSAIYIQAARRLAAGDGFTQMWPSAVGAPKPVAITWYPPGYPALLAVGGKLGIDAIPFARIIATLLLGAYVALAMTIIVAVARDRVAPMLAAIAIVLSTDQLEAFSYALSEPLFIVAALTSLLLLARFLEHQRGGSLIASACFASLAGMTRYLGIVLAPMGAILILMTPHRPRSRRLVDAIAFGVTALAGNLVWFIRNARVAGSSTGRALQWHPVAMGHLHALVATIAQWVLPRQIAGSLIWLVAILIVAGTILVAVAASSAAREAVMPRVLVAFTATYVLGLAAAISWIDAATPVDYRLLAPLFVPIVALTIVTASRTRHGGQVALALFALVFISDLMRLPPWIWRANQFGERLGYASLRWDKSRTMRLLARLPADLPVWTNASDATYLRAGRIDRSIPSRYTRDGSHEVETYPDAIAQMRTALRSNGGAVVYFSGVLRHGVASADDIDRALAGSGMKRIEYPNDAVIWAHPFAARRFPAPATPHTMPSP